MTDREKVIKGLEGTEIMLKQAVDRGGEMAVMGAFKCYNHVSDAIALLKEQQQQIWELQDQAEYLTDKLKEQEAVEPVKLVRCKNCKHCDSERIDKNMIWCKIHQFGRPDDYYCADGIEK